MKTPGNVRTGTSMCRKGRIRGTVPVPGSSPEDFAMMCSDFSRNHPGIPYGCGSKGTRPKMPVNTLRAPPEIYLPKNPGNNGSRIPPDPNTANPNHQSNLNTNLSFSMDKGKHVPEILHEGGTETAQPWCRTKSGGPGSRSFSMSP